VHDAEDASLSLSLSLLVCLFASSCGDKPEDTGVALGDSAEPSTWYADADGDGYGDSDAPTEAVDAPTGHVDNDEDCDDGDAEVHPGADEACDGVDNDCDGEVDGAEALDATTWYEDGDGDGYGCEIEAAVACVQPAGSSASSDDCDDSDASVNPGEEEICEDSLDNDCDGQPDPRCRLEGSWPADQVHAKLFGEDEDDLAGWEVRILGDISGDGLSDIALYTRDGWHLVDGPVSGEGNVSGWSFLQLLSDSKLGFYYDYNDAVESADLNGDGAIDLVVSSFTYDPDERRNLVFYGPQSGTLSPDSADASFLTGPLMSGDFYPVTSQGADFDGDGADDLAVGDYGFYGPEYTGSPHTGRGGGVLLFPGPIEGDLLPEDASAVITGGWNDIYAGYSLSSGDMDGDGLEELLIGAPTDRYDSNQASSAFLLYGPISGDRRLRHTDGLVEADAWLVGDGQDSTGMRVAAEGDLDGDGRTDLALGAAGYDPEGDYAYEGAVYVVLGAVTGTIDLLAESEVTIVGAADQSLGSVASSAGDIDGDGVDDLLITGNEADDGVEDNGAYFLFYGPLSGSLASSDADARFVGDHEDHYGRAVSTSGDVDGDGFDDILIGATGDHTNGEWAGAAYLLYGGGD